MKSIGPEKFRQQSMNLQNYQMMMCTETDDGKSTQGNVLNAIVHCLNPVASFEMEQGVPRQGYGIMPIVRQTLLRDAGWDSLIGSVVSCCWSYNSFPAKFMVGNTVCFTG